MQKTAKEILHCKFTIHALHVVLIKLVFCATSSYINAFFICRHLACEDDQIEVAKLLLTYGAQWDVQNKRKKMPFELLKSESTASMLQGIATSRQSS